MPEISEDEFKKFQKWKKQRQIKDSHRDIYLSKLKTFKDKMLDINASYGTISAQALYLAKWLDELEGDVFYFNWDQFKNFLTDTLLKQEPDGKISVKRSFRKRLLEREWRMHLNRKHNTIKVEKVK